MMWSALSLLLVVSQTFGSELETPDSVSISNRDNAPQLLPSLILYPNPVYQSLLSFYSSIYFRNRNSHLSSFRSWSDLQHSLRFGNQRGLGY